MKILVSNDDGYFSPGITLLAEALGTGVECPTVDQLRSASDLIAEHAEWRSGRADLSAGESAGDDPPTA